MHYHIKDISEKLLCFKLIMKQWFLKIALMNSNYGRRSFMQYRQKFIFLEEVLVRKILFFKSSPIYISFAQRLYTKNFGTMSLIKMAKIDPWNAHFIPSTQTNKGLPINLDKACSVNSIIFPRKVKPLCKFLGKL